MKIYRARLAGFYILSEMLPSFILGNVVFLFILLMFQVLRLSDLVINKGVPLGQLLQLIMYIMVSFLPAVIPISLLFCILLTLGRMSSDSEIVAFKAAGLNLFHILLPTVLFSLSVALISAYVSFFAAPWGNRAFEVLITRIATSKAAANLQEGTFADDFYERVLYAGKINSKQNTLKNVFIYDESNPDNPVTVIASEGKIMEPDPSAPGKGIVIRLINGNVHKNSLNNYAKVDFKTYDFSLSNLNADSVREKSPQSYNYDDLQNGIHNPAIKGEDRRSMLVEIHKRWAISVACIVFGLLGVGTGTVTNRRAVRASGLVVSLIIMVSYWILYVAGESLSRNGTLPPWFAMWFANVLFTGFGIYSFRKAW